MGEKIFQNLQIMAQVGDGTFATNNIGNHHFCGFTGVLCPLNKALNKTAAFWLSSHISRRSSVTNFCFVFCIGVYSYKHVFPCIYKVVISRCPN